LYQSIWCQAWPDTRFLQIHASHWECFYPLVRKFAFYDQNTNSFHFFVVQLLEKNCYLKTPPNESVPEIDTSLLLSLSVCKVGVCMWVCERYSNCNNICVPSAREIGIPHQDQLVVSVYFQYKSPNVILRCFGGNL